MSSRDLHKALKEGIPVIQGTNPSQFQNIDRVKLIKEMMEGAGFSLEELLSKEYIRVSDTGTLDKRRSPWLERNSKIYRHANRRISGRALFFFSGFLGEDPLLCKKIVAGYDYDFTRIGSSWKLNLFRACPRQKGPELEMKKHGRAWKTWDGLQVCQFFFLMLFGAL